MDFNLLSINSIYIYKYLNTYKYVYIYKLWCISNLIYKKHLNDASRNSDSRIAGSKHSDCIIIPFSLAGIYMSQKFQPIALFG